MLPLILAATIVFTPAPGPAMLRSSDPSDVTPVWVSADAAFDELRFRTELFEPKQLDRLEENQRRRGAKGQGPDSPCTLFSGELPHPSLAARTIDGLIAQAQGIYVGIVDAETPGFFEGRPASLLRVKVSTTLESSPALNTSGELYVVYPAAEFVAGGRRFCARALYNQHRPKVAEVVLLFVFRPPVDAEGTLVSATSGDLFFQSVTASLHAPEVFRTELTRLKLESLAAVTEYIARRSR